MIYSGVEHVPVFVWIWLWWILLWYTVLLIGCDGFGFDRLCFQEHAIEQGIPQTTWRAVNEGINGVCKRVYKRLCFWAHAIEHIPFNMTSHEPLAEPSRAEPTYIQDCACFVFILAFQEGYANVTIIYPGHDTPMYLSAMMVKWSDDGEAKACQCTRLCYLCVLCYWGWSHVGRDLMQREEVTTCCVWKQVWTGSKPGTQRENHMITFYMCMRACIHEYPHFGRHFIILNHFWWILYEVSKMKLHI